MKIQRGVNANTTRYICKLGVLSWNQQVNAQQANGCTKGVDEEIGIEAKLLDKPTADGHRDEEGGRDERYLQHVDGVAVTDSRDSTDWKATNAKA